MWGVAINLHIDRAFSPRESKIRRAVDCEKLERHVSRPLFFKVPSTSREQNIRCMCVGAFETALMAAINVRRARHFHWVTIKRLCLGTEFPGRRGMLLAFSWAHTYIPCTKPCITEKKKCTWVRSFPVSLFACESGGLYISNFTPLKGMKWVFGRDPERGQTVCCVTNGAADPVLRATPDAAPFAHHLSLSPLLSNRLAAAPWRYAAAEMQIAEQKIEKGLSSFVVAPF